MPSWNRCMYNEQLVIVLKDQKLDMKFMFNEQLVIVLKDLS